MPTEDTFILVHGTESDSTGREKISSTSPTNTPMYQISDTDLYLLGAIEKLAHRTQILEKRIKTLEEMFHYSLIGKELIRGASRNDRKQNILQYFIYFRSLSKEIYTNRYSVLFFLIEGNRRKKLEKRKQVLQRTYGGFIRNGHCRRKSRCC